MAQRRVLTPRPAHRREVHASLYVFLIMRGRFYKFISLSFSFSSCTSVSPSLSLSLLLQQHSIHLRMRLHTCTSPTPAANTSASASFAGCPVTSACCAAMSPKSLWKASGRSCRYCRCLPHPPLRQILSLAQLL